MFFPRLRAQAKWVFVLLAIVFAASFVLFGVGTGFGGLGDILHGNAGSSSSGPSVSDAQARIAKNPQNAPAYKELATALQNEGKIDAAIPPLEKYVAMRPRDESALNTLGSLYSDRLQRLGQRYASAQAASQEATFGGVVQPQLQAGKQTLPQDPITQAEVAKTDAAIGAVQSQIQSVSTKAVSTYQKLAKLSPSDPSLQLQLAQIAETANNVPVAVKALKRFIKLAPEDSSVPLVKQELKRLRQFSGQTGG
jgi:tetratricopeptide (TPR) repeat protein